MCYSDLHTVWCQSWTYRELFAQARIQLLGEGLWLPKAVTARRTSFLWNLWVDSWLGILERGNERLCAQDAVWWYSVLTCIVRIVNSGNLCQPHKEGLLQPPQPPPPWIRTWHHHCGMSPIDNSHCWDTICKFKSLLKTYLFIDAFRNELL